MTSTPTDPSPVKRERHRLRTVLVALAAVLALVAGVAGWALNRYVIDHVKIGDVSAYEATAATVTLPPTTVPAGSSTAGSTVSSTDSTAATAGASTAASAAIAAAATTTTASAAATAAVTAPKITIDKVVTGSGADTVTYFVADVVLRDATQLRSAFAEDKFGENIVANTSTIAAQNNARFAINGDYYGYRRSGIVIRNGVVYRDVPARQGLAISRDGTMKLYDEKSTTADALVAAGVWNTLSFGPGLLQDGEIPAGIDQVEVDTNIGNHPIQGEQPRTGIGMIGPNHLVFVAADGRRSGYSRGVTMPEFAAIFKGLGATVAYNLDGGGSTTMYFDGAVVNNPLGKGKERGTSDILYIGAAA